MEVEIWGLEGFGVGMKIFESCRYWDGSWSFESGWNILDRKGKRNWVRIGRVVEGKLGEGGVIEVRKSVFRKND